jgi:threonine dehydratase
VNRPTPDAAEVRREAMSAAVRIDPFVRLTPIERCAELSEAGGCDVWFKLENYQSTGSFKIRGAASALTALPAAAGERGVLTASTGNHGAAAAHMLSRLGWPGIVVVPRTASPSKVDRLRRLGVELVIHGDDCVEAELYAREVADERRQTFLPPYNDLRVVAGQGTVAVEVERQLEGVDSVLIPVGGGGLAAGMAAVLKSARPEIEIVGCQPAASPVMARSVRAGRIVELASAPTLSDATAGGLEDGSITFELCRTLVDRFVLVDEDEILAAMLLLLDRHRLLVEGAGALPVAAFMREARRHSGRRVLLVLTGSSIGLGTLRDLVGSTPPSSPGARGGVS